MKHLQDAEFVDLLEGTLRTDRAAHARACDACRAQVDALRSSMASASAVASGEPPEMFWQHFGARVNARIDAPQPARTWWSLPRFAVATAAVLVFALTALNYVRPVQNAIPAPSLQQTATFDADPSFIAFDDLESDEGWAVVRAAAEDLDADAAASAGLSAGPGAVEQVASQLTEAERAELIRLVEDEMKRSGA